jgi:glutamyl-tRNA synthetase
MNQESGKVIVRMAPSPTGNLHIGTARTALFNYLFARKVGGKYILRLEDTDKERSTKEFEENILDGFSWLGFEHDELYRQSERGEIYASYIKNMISDGKAYVSKEEPKEPGQREEVIRFKNPNKLVVFEDLIRGEIQFDTTELGDFVVARGVDDPLYHLAVVIDDHEMGVTHIIRGEDHISNTPRQILIQEAIGALRPVYAHIPLIFDQERAKLSKRKHGARVWVESYREQGYLPEAFVNFLALLGWHPEGDKEIYSLEELIEEFDLKRAQKGGAIFDEQKLRWVNKEHIKRMPWEEISHYINDKIMISFPQQAIAPEVTKLVFERIETLSDVGRMIEAGELNYFFSKPNLDPSKIAWKDSTNEDVVIHLKRVKEIISNDADLMGYAEEAGKGNVLWPLRYVLSGREKSPDPFTLLKVLGKEEALGRVESAIKLLDSAN